MATTKTLPTQGDKYRLTASAGHGIGIGAVPVDTVVAVDLAHTNPVAGVGGTEGVLFSWIPEGEEYPRSSHLPRTQFQRLFKKVGK